MVGSVPASLSFSQITCKLAWIIALVVVFSSACLSARPRVDPNALYKVGDYRDIKIMVPKEGFVGAPPAGRGYPDRNFETPISENDFRINHVRITVLEARKLKSNVRIAFQLDEISEEGDLIVYPGLSDRDVPRHEPVYYAYLFIRADRVRMAEQRSPIHSDKRMDDWEPGDFRERPGTAWHYGMEFPLPFTWPPVLNPHESMRDNSWVFGGSVVLYDEATLLPERNAIKIGVTYLDKVDLSRDPNRPDLLYYSPSEKTYDKEKKPDGLPVRFIVKETQIWANNNDWLWQEMERTDARGHVTMRCRRMP
jgi:hypothetical protein